MNRFTFLGQGLYDYNNFVVSWVYLKWHFYDNSNLKLTVKCKLDQMLAFVMWLENILMTELKLLEAFHSEVG